MEYIYSAMLLHKAGKPINEANVKKVLEAAGVKPNEARIKALVAALQGVDIDKAIEKTAVVPVAAAAPASGAEKPSEKKPEKAPEEEKKSEEQAAAGLGALFG